MSEPRPHDREAARLIAAYERENPHDVGAVDGTEDDYGDLLGEVATGLGIEPWDENADGVRMDDIASNSSATAMEPWLADIETTWQYGRHKDECEIHAQRESLQLEIKDTAAAGNEDRLAMLRGAEREFYGRGDQDEEGCTCGLYDEMTIKLTRPQRDALAAVAEHALQEHHDWLDGQWLQDHMSGLNEGTLDGALKRLTSQ